MDIRAVAMGVMFAIMWSSAFASARIIVADAPPLSALSIRFLISGLLAVAIARALGQKLPVGAVQWRATAIFGLCQNALYLGLNFVAMQWVEASLAAIIASTMPLLVALAGWWFLKERVSAMAICGLISGAIGVALIMGTRLNGGADAFGIGLCVVGVVALTVATMTVKNASSGGNILMVVGLQMLIGSGVLAIAAVSLETWQVTYSWQLAAAFVYTTIVPGLLATWVWFLLVARIGAIRAATFHFLNPFLGVGVAALILGESLGGLDVLGVAIIAGGILAVQLSKQVGH